MAVDDVDGGSILVALSHRNAHAGVHFFFSSRKRHTMFLSDWSSDVCSSDLLYSFFFSGRRRHTRCLSDWSSDVCSSDLVARSLRRTPPPASAISRAEGPVG